MAQKIITICDWHQQEKGEDVEADTYPLAGFEVDLCESCAKQMPLADGVQFAIEFGRKATTPPKARRKPKAKAEEPVVVTVDDVTCPTCGFVGKSPQGLAQHLTRQGHG